VIVTDAEQGLALHDGRQLPTTKDLRTVLREGLDAVQTEEYAARGGAEIEKPEDAYALIRRYAAMEETAVDYGRAFLDFAKDVRERSGEQLSLMYGEQDGVPNADAAVPDTDGTTIKVKRQHENRYQFNVDTIISAAVVDMLADDDVSEALAEMFQAEFRGDPQVSISALTWVLAEAVKRVLATGKFEAQVTKVKALAKQAASRGDDQLASTVTGAIDKKTRLKGITLEREQPKEK
jgi:hypothetical protein